MRRLLRLTVAAFGLALGAGCSDSKDPVVIKAEEKGGGRSGAVPQPKAKK